MSYDPDARIDKFIRESVLEKRDVDFGKLISAKESIQRLNENFDAIQLEICELDQILGEYDSWESERNRLLSDDIRIVYKKMQDLQQEIRRQSEQAPGVRTRKGGSDCRPAAFRGKEKPGGSTAASSQDQPESTGQHTDDRR